jgi:hypothetical protein
MSIPLLLLLLLLVTRNSSKDMETCSKSHVFQHEIQRDVATLTSKNNRASLRAGPSGLESYTIR